MPISKNFDLRRKILDRLIAKRVPKYSRQQLFDKLNEILVEDKYPEISMRQFSYDIDQMKLDALRDGGELNYDRRNKQYYYDPESFSLTGIPIQQKDIELLTQAIAILKSINGLRSTRELELIIERLAEKIGVSVKDLEGVIVFDEVPDLKGIEHLNRLLNKIIEKQVIVMHYKPYEGNEISYIFHPYFLKEYNNRWYVIGWNEEEDMIYNVPLDRIVDFEDSYSEYNDTKRVSSTSYFKDIIGLRKNDGKPQKLTYQFQKPRAYYVETKPLHHSQKKVKETENYIQFEINVIPNPELKSLISSFGDDVKSVK